VIQPAVAGSSGREGPRFDPGPRAPNRGEVSVLIVDDDPVTRDTIARYLALEGHLAFAAATGDEGLEECERLAPDVILLDYHLPDCTGLAWLRRVRSRPMVKPPRVIVFTADWEVERDAEAVHALGGSIVSKLCDLDEIVSMLAARPVEPSI